MRVAAIAGLFFSIWISTPAAGAPLQPSGPWHVDYDDTQCLASRNYGSGSKPTTLTLVPSATGAAMRILFVRDGRTEQRQEQVKLGLGAQKPVDTYSFIYDVPANNHRVILVNIPMAEFRAAAPSGKIGIESDSLSAEFTADLLPAVLIELDKCLVDLQKSWNITIPLPQAPLAPPTSSTDKLVPIFTAADYPAVAQYRGLSGVVGVSILIDERGKVADCTVDRPSGVGTLDVVTCYVIQKRAHFTPARDATGKAIRSAVSQNVTWRLTP